MVYKFPVVIEKDKNNDNIYKAFFPDITCEYRALATNEVRALLSARDLLEMQLRNCEEVRNITPKSASEYRKIYKHVRTVKIVV